MWRRSFVWWYPMTLEPFEARNDVYTFKIWIIFRCATVDIISVEETNSATFPRSQRSMAFCNRNAELDENVIACWSTFLMDIWSEILNYRLMKATWDWAISLLSKEQSLCHMTNAVALPINWRLINFIQIAVVSMKVVLLLSCVSRGRNPLWCINLITEFIR